MTAETYSVRPNYILKPKGLFEWERTIDINCRCGHKKEKHLNSNGICLDLAGMDHTCICEVFTSPNQPISTFSRVQKKGLPKKEETADIIVKDGKITQDDQGKFMREYGII